MIVKNVPTNALRFLLYLYIVLWLIEGGLRRWIFPSLATPLLVIRDPVVLLIYLRAIKEGAFPRSGLVYATVILAPISFFAAVFLGHGNPIVAMYGVRCDFLHVPLVHIFMKAFRPQDVKKLCLVALWISIPYTALLFLQFYSPQSAWVNRGLGGDFSGAGFTGALGKFRPPGTFSFITGPAQLYPMLLAAWFYLLTRRELSFILMLLSGSAIILAVPVSVSRSLFLAELFVAFMGALSLLQAGIISTRTVLKGLLAASFLSGVAWTVFNQTDAFDAFFARWDSATTQNGGVQDAIVYRILDGFISPFYNLPTLGYGTGISTQVGQKVATGTNGFGYSEGEWGRILAEGGMVLGGFILIYRLAIGLQITHRSYNALVRGRGASLGFWAASLPMVFLGQWGQSTTLGSSVIAAGICLAATKKGVSRLNRNKVHSCDAQVHVVK